MPNGSSATPRLTVHLYKTISRKTVDGQGAVSARYEGKDAYIDITPFLGDASSVRTTKSVREAAGGFSITVSDQPQKTGLSLESLSGLIEPMDLVEIRMWSGIGAKPAVLPIIMRGFVSEIQRAQSVDEAGRPQRSVTITGQDYGKIWQTFQVIYLSAYAEKKALLTNFNLWDLFGADVRTAMRSGDFVREMIEKVINPHLDGFMPENTEMKRQLLTGDSISVKHGVVNNSYHGTEGSIYDILKKHGDVGVWNELYTEDREDGVHVVYRAIPALKISSDVDEEEQKKNEAKKNEYSKNLEAKKAEFEALKKEWRAAQDAEVAPLLQEAQSLVRQAQAATGDLQKQLIQQATDKNNEGKAKLKELADKYEARYDALEAEIKAPPPGANSAPASARTSKDLIQDDALDPIYVEIPDDRINSMNTSRSDANVANFYWVNNSLFDLIDDMQRKLHSIPAGDAKVSLKEYPNTAVKYYGVRLMQASTQQADEAIVNLNPGQKTGTQKKRSDQQEAWIDKRRRLMMDMNKDNVVFERGTARIKGGPMRADGSEAMKAGDYALFKMGRMTYEAYVVAIDHEFIPLQRYTTTLTFERGTGFVERARTLETASPWLYEQATREKK